MQASLHFQGLLSGPHSLLGETVAVDGVSHPQSLARFQEAASAGYLQGRYTASRRSGIAQGGGSHALNVKMFAGKRIAACSMPAPVYSNQRQHYTFTIGCQRSIQHFLGLILSLALALAFPFGVIPTSAAGPPSVG